MSDHHELWLTTCPSPVVPGLPGGQTCVLSSLTAALPVTRLSRTDVHLLHCSFRADFHDPVGPFTNPLWKEWGEKQKLYLKDFSNLLSPENPDCLLGGPLESVGAHFPRVTCERKWQEEPKEEPLGNVCWAEPGVLCTQAQTPTHSRRKLLWWTSEWYSRYGRSIPPSCAIKSESQVLFN